MVNKFNLLKILKCFVSFAYDTVSLTYLNLRIDQYEGNTESFLHKSFSYNTSFFRANVAHAWHTQNVISGKIKIITEGKSSE